MYYKYNNDGKLIGFDSRRFIRDHDNHLKSLESLKAQVNELSAIKGIDTTREKVTSTPKQDGLENVALLKINLEDRIKIITSYIKTYHMAMSGLPPEQSRLLQIMYSGHYPHPLNSAVKEFHISRSTVFRELKKARDNFTQIATGLNLE